MDPKLLEILACPRCKQPLALGKARQYLICEPESIAYPILDGVPQLIDSAAITLAQIETAKMSSDA